MIKILSKFNAPNFHYPNNNILPLVHILKEKKFTLYSRVFLQDQF